MQDIDIGAALDLLSRSLAVAATVVGLAVALSQFTRPAVLRNREKWLRTALAEEKNKHRQALLRELLDRTTARLVAGLLFPYRYYLEMAFWLILAPTQAFLLAQQNKEWWNFVIAMLAAALSISQPIRRLIRILAERARFLHEYIEAKQQIRKPRTDLLATMEGGSRREFTFAYLSGMSIGLVATGGALAFSDSFLLGVGVAAPGLVGLAVLPGLIRRYVADRKTIAGPYPKDHPPA